MFYYLSLYAVGFVSFLVIDFIWLGFVAKNYYFSQLGDLLRTPFNLPAAFVFYALFVVGLLYFAVLPGLASHSFLRTLFLGALFGFFTYATYDLTNLATLKNWPLALTFVDILWGTVLSASVSAVVYYVATHFLPR